MKVYKALGSPAVVRGLLSLVAALAVLLFPDLLGTLLVYLIGVGAIGVGFVDIWAWWKLRDRSDLLQGVVLVVAGLVILFGGDAVNRSLQLIVAALIAVRGLRAMYVAARGWRGKTDVDPFWPGVKGVFALFLAASLVVIPETLITLVVLIIVGVWIVSGVIILVNAVGADEGSAVPSDLVGVIRSRSMPADLRKQVTEAVFEGWDSSEGTIRFAALMSFATAIATFGIKADSTAVVIGAMLVAPLMSPIMALSASILMGWPKRAGFSAWRIGLGVAIGIGGSFLMSLISPEFVPITANSEVLSRVSPTILDMLIALAAGAAGGYAMTHPQVSNSLPGVAISVALAPPLAVVGVSLQATEFVFASGAFLLFLTNLVGIVVAGGLAFVFSGYSPWTKLARSGDQTRRSLALIGIATLLVGFPLAVIGQDIVDAASAQSVAQESVDEWLGDESDLEAVKVTVHGGDVDVVLLGDDEVPAPEELARTLATELKKEISLDVRVIPETRYLVSAPRPRSAEDE